MADDELPELTVVARKPPPAALPSFTVKQLRATLTLDQGCTVFPGTNSSVLVLNGLRILSRIEGAGNTSITADVRIYGMRLADMNALTIAWFNPPVLTNNTILLESNDGNGWRKVFSGMMIDASPEFRAAPDVYFHILAISDYQHQIEPVAPSSYPGATDVATIVADIAKKMNLAFENNDVSVIISTPYLAGTLTDQLNKVATAANIDVYITNDVLAICNKNEPRAMPPTVVLNKNSGLIEYPIVEKFGITAQCIFNPAVIAGGKVKIESILKVANGTWFPNTYTHILESQRPGGVWLSTLKCYPVKG